MKTVLYPAIALMNRLSFGMKFSLISVLFFLPMLVTNFYLVRDSYRQFISTQAALESIDLLGESLALRRNLEDFVDLTEVNAMIGQSGQAGDLEARLVKLQGGIGETLQGMAAVVREPEQIEEFNSKRDQLIAELAAVQSESSLQGKIALAEKLLGSSQVFIKLVAAQAG
ncbi:MAG: methyl-accepting chemotaxis protein, partial [Pseudomonas sp.]